MMLTSVSRSAEYHSAVAESMTRCAPRDHPRVMSAYQCALMSLEHTAGTVALLTIGMPNAAMALFRPQFEALIRGVWLLEVADEKWVRQYHELLTEESAREADKAPGTEGDACRAARARKSARQQHRSTSERVSRTTLTDDEQFTHGGMHPMSRSRKGYPIDLIENVIRCANGLLIYAAQIAALVSTSPHRNRANCADRR